MKIDPQYWINRLGLKKHPEGGYFKETYRCDETVCMNALPKRFAEDKAFSTAIYFLLKGEQTSYFHRLKADELWHFYHGSSLTLHIIDPHGDYNKIQLGSNFENGETFQRIIKNGAWFGATVDDHTSYSLTGCTVAPGFGFNDFELANRDQMLKMYPEHALIIKKLTLPFL